MGAAVPPAAVAAAPPAAVVAAAAACAHEDDEATLVTADGAAFAEGGVPSRGSNEAGAAVDGVAAAGRLLEALIGGVFALALLCVLSNTWNKVGAMHQVNSHEAIARCRSLNQVEVDCRFEY